MTLRNIVIVSALKPFTSYKSRNTYKKCHPFIIAMVNLFVTDRRNIANAISISRSTYHENRPTLKLVTRPRNESGLNKSLVN